MAVVVDGFGHCTVDNVVVVVSGAVVVVVAVDSVQTGLLDRCVPPKLRPMTTIPTVSMHFPPELRKMWSSTKKKNESSVARQGWAVVVSSCYRIPNQTVVVVACRVLPIRGNRGRVKSKTTPTRSGTGCETDAAVSDPRAPVPVPVFVPATIGPGPGHYHLLLLLLLNIPRPGCRSDCHSVPELLRLSMQLRWHYLWLI